MFCTYITDLFFIRENSPLSDYSEIEYLLKLRRGIEFNNDFILLAYFILSLIFIKKAIEEFILDVTDHIIGY